MMLENTGTVGREAECTAAMNLSSQSGAGRA